MKIGIIAKPNQKGQVVIPREMRKKLGIGPATTLNIVLNDGSISLYPLTNVEGIFVAGESSYSKILQKTKGAWKNEKSETVKEKRVLELVASKKRKRSW